MFRSRDQKHRSPPSYQLPSARRAVRDEKHWSLQEGKLANLRIAADESARHVRGLYFKFLLFAFYVAVIVFSTTDEQLLKKTGTTLPLLDAKLPLVGFYVVVPWLVLIFHAHLLSQFYLLSRKLFDLDRELGSLPSASARIQRGLIFPLIFSQRIVGTHHPPLIRWVFGAAVVVTILVLPVILLLGIQWMFLPYHSGGITRIHQLVLTLDLLLLWIFWPLSSSRSGRWRDWWSESRPGWGIRISTSLGVLVSTILLFSAWILAVPHVGKAEKWLAEEWLTKDTQAGSAGSRQGLPWIHRNLELREQTLIRKEPPVELLSAARGKKDTETAEAEVWLEDGEALDLRGRDLSYADFYKSKLWDADLRGANLQHAKLQDTRLQGADMRPIDRDGVKKGTDLRYAQLQGANLKNAKLHEARLQGAVLWGAQLQGAVLRDTVVYGTDFRDAELSLADLRDLRSLPVGWEGLSSVFSAIEKLEAKLEQEGEHWSHGKRWLPDGRESVAQAIDRFWSIAFDPPLEPTVISPLQGFDVMYDWRGLFAAWPAPQDGAALEQAHADYRAGLACNNQYIAKRMWGYAKKKPWTEGDPVLEQALRVKAKLKECSVLAEVIEEDR